MEQHHLYAYQWNGMTNNYEGIENGEKLLNIYKGIYQHTSTHGNKVYPSLRRLGTVNITTRQFVKGSKHPRKVIIQEDGRLLIDGSICTRLPALFIELGYPETLLNEITNVVIAVSNDPKIHSSDYNRLGGEDDGIVNF